MIQIFRNLKFEAISFWSGFIAATLFWWLLRVTRHFFKRTWLLIRNKFQSLGEGINVTVEKQYRNEIMRFVQELHLSASLFSLDEILITPRFLAPPPLVDPDLPPPFEDIISTLIPFTPDYPEFASFFNAKTLGALDTLQHVDKIAIIGNPGTGKSTTLAYIAACLSRQTNETGMVRDFIPVYLHLRDLFLPHQEQVNPLSIILNGISFQIPNLKQSRIPQFSSYPIPGLSTPSLLN